MILLKQPD